MTRIDNYSLDEKTKTQEFLKGIQDWIMNKCGFGKIIC